VLNKTVYRITEYLDNDFGSGGAYRAERGRFLTAPQQILYFPVNLITRKAADARCV